MTTAKYLYSSYTTLTITLNSLANASARLSTAVDNSTNLYLDALIGVAIQGGTLGANPVYNVYAYGLMDGTNYTDQDRMGTAGTDSAFTLGGNPLNVKLIGVCSPKANATTEYFGPFSVALAFGGILPQKWGIIIDNESGAALDASAGGTVSYCGVQVQSV